jgi:hypothetical protein
MGNAKILDFFLNEFKGRGFVNVKDDYNNSLLMIGCTFSKEECVKRLIESGAYVCVEAVEKAFTSGNANIFEMVSNKFLKQTK